jgi:hypothetical protein
MTSSPPKEPEEPWRIAVNERYAAVVTTLISLASAALVIPIVFLRQMLAVPETEPLTTRVGWQGYVGWASLGASVVAGLVYHYSATKWVKLAWGRRIAVPEKVLERILDWSFWVAAAFFMAGIAFLLMFMATARGHSSSASA